MKNIKYIAVIAPILLSGCQSTGISPDIINSSINSGRAIFGNMLDNARNPALSRREIVEAFKQALTIGTGEVVTQLSHKNGFNLDPNIHIPLPKSLATVRSTLDKVGLAFMLDDLETKINYAAEIATPHAKELFFNAISEMTFDDVRNIYDGPEDSATQFFKSKMSAPLMQKMTPFVNNAVSQAGAVQAYDSVMARYSAIPFVPDVKADLTNYVVEQGVEGIFYYLAKQEAQIRQDPIRQTTALLKKVFGNK